MSTSAPARSQVTTSSRERASASDEAPVPPGALCSCIADEQGRPAVAAMQLHSAPGGTGASSEALARSLEEVVTWDLAGADVLIEHCDALVPGRTAAKGYLSLADELAAVRPGTSASQCSMSTSAPARSQVTTSSRERASASDEAPVPPGALCSCIATTAGRPCSSAMRSARSRARPAPA